MRHITYQDGKIISDKTVSDEIADQFEDKVTTVFKSMKTANSLADFKTAVASRF